MVFSRAQVRPLVLIFPVPGEPRDGATAHAEDFPPGATAALRVLGADLSNGLLAVDLFRPEPERIVRRIDIAAKDDG